MKWKKFAVGIVIALLSSIIVYSTVIAQEQSIKDIRVKVTVTAKSLTSVAPTNLTSVATSYLTRELRSLGDVIVVNDATEAKWALDIAVLEIPLQLLVYSVSRHGILHSASLINLKSELEKAGPLTSEQRHVLEELEHEERWLIRSLYLGTDLGVCPRDDLKQTCQEIVADFDSSYLEPINRATAEELLDRIEELSRQLQQRK